MDKAAPKDVFQANRDRAAPLLKQLRADGIGHMIDGKVVASISGDSLETTSPIDGAALATVARGNAEDIDRDHWLWSPACITAMNHDEITIRDGHARFIRQGSERRNHLRNC